MKNLIPHFIYDRFKEGVYKGKFDAVTMFLDISGFTPMTERLMKEGKEGAEVLSRILNNIFTPVVESIYNRGGFISIFAGDALTAIFPINDYIRTVFSALEINKIFKEQGFQKTRFGNFELSVKLGLSFGDVDWGILGTDTHKTFYFRGEAIDGCAKSEHHCNKMDIVLDNKLYQKVSSNIEAHCLDESYFLLDKIAIDEHKQTTSIEQKHLDENVLLLFVPKELINYTQKGEFRNIVSVFISFKEPDNFDELDTITSFAIDKTDNFGGYFNKIDFGDKGGTMLVFFGSPVSYEDNVKRAVDFILALKEKFGDVVRAGLTIDIAYSGFVGSELRCEYTCLGDVVNLSARFIMKAEFGQIWVSKAILDKVKETYNTRDLGAKDFKGKSKPIPVFELLEVKHKRAMKLFEGEMVGRKKEYEELRSYCKTILDGKFGDVVYVYGEAGIGKSRLVYEATESLKPDIDIYTLQTDSILKSSMNPFIYMLNNYFNQYQGKNDDERKELFEKTYEDMLSTLSTIQNDIKDEIISELIRTKSFIGAIIGHHWKDSLYETLDPKGRYENTVFALKTFFKAHSLIKPIIILLEDLHWIDNDSQEVFRTLTRNITDYPIIIIATSRNNDDGTKPKFLLDKDIHQKEVDITHLQDDSISLFIEKQVKNKVDNKLIEFIKTKSQGNPFFIEQFCLYLIENKLIDIVNGLYKLVRRDVDIPVSINSILIARIDRLSFELKETVQIASVLGREIDITILFELITTIKKAIETNKLNELVISGEKEQLWSSISEIKYIFKHTLLREAVYDMQLREQLRLLHRLTGEIMEKLYYGKDEKYSDIAYHFDRGENFEKAKNYYEMSGDYLKDNYKNTEALEQYDKLFGLETNDDKKIDICIKKSSILNLIGKYDESISILNYGLELCKNPSQDLKKYDVLLNIADTLHRKTEYNKAIEILDNLIEICKSLSDTENKKLHSRAFTILGNIYSNKGQLDKALEYYLAGKKICEKKGDKKGLTIIIGSIGNIYVWKGDYNKAMECYEMDKLRSEETNDKLELGRAIGNIGTVYHYTGKYDKAMEYYELQKKIYEEIGFKKGFSMVIGNIGFIHSGLGKYDKAMEHFELQKIICEEINDKSGLSLVLGNIGMIYYYKGNFEKTMEYYELQKNLCNEIEDRRGFCRVIGNIGYTHYELGNFDKAIENFEQQKTIAEELGENLMISGALSNSANAYADKGLYEKALSNFNKAIEIAKNINAKYYLCSYLFNKANFLFNIYQKMDEVSLINNEAFQIAKEVNRKNIIFYSNTLKYKILALSDKKSSIEALLKLLSGNNEDDAQIYYELWKITDNQEYRDKATSLYQSLYDKTPKYDYKKRMEEMKK